MLYLIDHPDFDSPNNSFGILSDLAQLPTMTTRVLACLPVRGRRFPPNAAWFEWARDNGCLPTEEEEAEESRNAMEMKGELGQKGCEVIVVHTNTATSEGGKVSRRTYNANELVKWSNWILQKMLHRLRILPMRQLMHPLKLHQIPSHPLRRYAICLILRMKVFRGTLMHHAGHYLKWNHIAF